MRCELDGEKGKGGVRSEDGKKDGRMSEGTR